MTRTALVTGASSGIGRSLAKSLARAGYLTICVARRGPALKELCKELGDRHTYLQLDLTRQRDLDKLRHHLRTQPVDLLVNSAGMGVYGKFGDRDISPMLRLNVFALTELSRFFLQTAKPGNALINVSSVLAYAPAPYACAYSATKAFVSSFTEALWYEYRDKGIYVMNLCPAATATNFHLNAGQRNPRKTLMQSPDRVADIALQALQHRKRPTIIPSLGGKFFFCLSRTLPRRVLLAVVGKIMRVWSHL